MRSETDGIVVNRREKREQLHTVKKVDLPEAQSVSQAVTSSNSPCYSSFIYKKKQKKFLVCERFKVVVYCVDFTGDHKIGNDFPSPGYVGSVSIHTSRCLCKWFNSNPPIQHPWLLYRTEWEWTGQHYIASSLLLTSITDGGSGPFKKIKIRLPIFRGKPVFIKENRRRMLRSWSNCRSRTYTLWMTFANDLFIYFIPVIFLWFINNWQDSAVLCETWFPWNGYCNPNLYWWNGNHFFVGFCFSGKDPNI